MPSWPGWSVRAQGVCGSEAGGADRGVETGGCADDRGDGGATPHGERGQGGGPVLAAGGGYGDHGAALVPPPAPNVGSSSRTETDAAHSEVVT